MTTIYATPYNESTGEQTGESTDSGFTSINQVIETMGDEYERGNNHVVVYGRGEDQVIFSDFSFYAKHFDFISYVDRSDSIG